MKLSIKIKKNIKLILVSSLIIVLVIYLFYLYRKTILEGFELTDSNTTIPLTPNTNRKTDFTQKYNCIYYYSGSVNVSEIDFGKRFVIKQIKMVGNHSGQFIKIGVKDDANNNINYMSESEFGITSPENSFQPKDKKGKLLDKFETFYIHDNYVNNDMRDSFGRELIGNKLIIETMELNDYVSKNNLQSERFILNDSFSSIQPRPPLKIIITGHLVGEKKNYDENQIDVSEQEITFDDNSEDNENYLLHEIKFKNFSEGENINIFFKNNLSDNTFMYYSNVEHENTTLSWPKNSFYVNTSNGLTKVYFMKPIIANYIKIIDTDDNELTNYEIYGRLASLSEISAFKLNYGITDIKSSVNPEDVCPTVDKLIDDHLKMDMIMDGMEYQDKVRNEKQKMLYNKNKLLELQSQEKEIKKLTETLNNVDKIQKLKDIETDVHNSMQFSKQLTEVMKLKDLLDEHLERREKNTLDVDIGLGNANLNINGDNFTPGKLPKEEKLRLFDN